MNIAPLIAAVICFAVAGVALLRPESIQSWMRRRSNDVSPSALKEFCYRISAPTFAVGGIAFGVISIVAFVADH